MPLQSNGSLATTLLITKGLPCKEFSGSPPDREICAFGAGITPWFGLYCEIVAPPPKPKAGGMGGSKPLLPGEIHNLYQVLPPQQQYYVVPRDQEARYFARYQTVVVKMKIGDKEIEKNFRVREPRANGIATVISLLNVTKERMSVSLDHIKRVTSHAIVTVKNLVLRTPKR